MILFALAAVSLVFLCLYLKEHLKHRVLVEKYYSLEKRSRELEGAHTLLHAKELEIERFKAQHTAHVEALQNLMTSFKALSQEALEKNNCTFLDLAATSFATLQEKARGDLDKRQQLIAETLNPVKEALQQIDLGMKALEKERKGEQESLKTQLSSLIETERMLRRETASLVKALRAPVVRGRWGEIQLRRVVELAGMLSHCDFFEQPQETLDEGVLRPDLIVRLPGERQVVVDAKAPLDAYLDALSAQDEEVRAFKLKEHARHIRTHLAQLSKKAYWEAFQPTPEFVILFLPSETFFSAALEQDPTLIEIGVEQGVILATPTTLITLLRSVAYGWKQESLSRHVQEISELGQELYKRLSDMGGHFSKMGKSLTHAVEAYNKGIGSLETRVLVTARKFKEMGAASVHTEPEPIELIDSVPREPVA